MRILVDENVPLAQELFGSHGDVVFFNGRSLSKIDLNDAKALICRSVTKANESLLSGSAIEFVGSCTIGTDHLDIDYLNNRHIRWVNAPGCNAQSVAEYVISCLALINKFHADFKVGIVGCGNVGSRVYEEMEGIGMSCSAYDPFRQEDPSLSDDKQYTSLEDAMNSDIVCVHTPFTTGGTYPTELMIGYAELALLKENAVLLSAGRGGVVDERAMVEVSVKRPDINWVMDVWANEPDINVKTHELAAIGTPHIAGYSLEGKQNGTKQVYDAFCKHFGVTANNDLKQSDERIQVPGKISSLKQLILTVYNPKHDGVRMTAARLDDSDNDASLSWFDALRKNYPIRHERTAYVFKNALLNEAEHRIALALGFQFG